MAEARAETARQGWRIVAGAVGAAIASVTLLSALIWFADSLRSLPVTYGRSPIGVLGLILAPLCYAAVGWVLASRVPRNPIGWLFLGAGAALGSVLPVNLIVAAVLESLRPASPVVIAVAWARTIIAVPTILALLVIAALIFPNGRPLPGRWRFGVWVAGVAGVVLAVATALDPRGLQTYPSIVNPTALPYAMEPLVSGLRILGVGLMVPVIVAAVASVWMRHRHGDPIVRAQLRWIAFGVGVSSLFVLPYLAVRYLVQVDDATGELISAAAQVGSCAFPVAAAFAISRYRLYEVDILIGRTLVYLPLSAALGGLYTAGIALFQRVFVALTGQTSDVAVVLSILMVASAFTPLRRWLESAVEVRFTPAKASRGDPATASAPVLPTPAPAAGPMPGSGAVAAPTAPLPGPARVPSEPHVVPFARLVSVDGTGSVGCPLAPGRSLRDCLECPYLTALAREPDLTVVCQPPI